MEGGEECSSNESGWTKYIDPSDHSSIDDDDDDDNDHVYEHNYHHHQNHHHHYGGYKKNKDNDDDDDDSIESDASSGPGYHYGHEAQDHHHGSRSFSLAGKKPSKDQVMKERNERNNNNTGKGKETMLKTSKTSTGFVFKQRKGKKPN